MAEQTEKATALRILARQQFLENCISFIGAITYKRGVVLKSEAHKNHTDETRELKDFYDFTFFTSGPHSMFGGEETKVWYMGKLVLEVHWHNIKECRVITFDSDPLWQEVIMTLYTAERESQEQKRREAEEKRTSEALARSIEKQLQEITSHAGKEAQRLKLVL